MQVSHIVFTIVKIITSVLLVTATSINYGIRQQPITDINQLMPTLCQNQSVICEGSFCIPGVKKCVCDLRQPVQFGRFCLRQVDIETKCFATSQCNHTIRDAVCLEKSSNSILDTESSKFKLEQWQQLNELRQASKSTLSANQQDAKTKPGIANSRKYKTVFLTDSNLKEELSSIMANENVIMSEYRNSPYEINYYTPELLKQNHTRRKTSSNDDRVMIESQDPNESNGTQSDGLRASSNDESEPNQQSSEVTGNVIHSIISTEITTQPFTSSSNSPPSSHKAIPVAASYTTTTAQSYYQESDSRMGANPQATTSANSIALSNELSKKKLITKTPNWPPGFCSCPLGYMFDPMLRKCLALSLLDSHCQSDNDCKQIRSTHCSTENKKCVCDEPLVWNQTELTCQRPQPTLKTVDNHDPNRVSGNGSSKGESFIENFLPPLIMAKLLPDQTMLLMFFVLLVIICTLVLLKLIVRCCSSSNSALISPKSSKNRKGNATSNLLPPKSPYATLRKPEHKPSTQLSNFTQATRGRILNYDFEQDNPISNSSRIPQSPQPTHKDNHESGILDKGNSTLARLKGHKHKSTTLVSEGGVCSTTSHIRNTPDVISTEECLELNDNVSLSGQLDSENKSESNSVLAIPGPPPSQAPPYMLASAMKGQGSAIAAAAAAVANRRMQMAQRLGANEGSSSAKVPNLTPVFL